MNLTVRKAMGFQAKRRLRVLAMAGWMLVATGSAYCVDIPLPSEVQALIGMRLPPVRVEGKDIKRSSGAKPLPPAYVQMARTSIPNFIFKSSSSASGFAFEEGMLADKWPVFIVERIHKDMTTEVLDILMLPANLIDWRYVNGKLKHQHEHFKHVINRYSLSGSCRTGEEDERMIFGLIKQEKGKETCSHYSKRVKLAWMIDQESGKITPVPTQGLQCFYLTMDDCF